MKRFLMIAFVIAVVGSSWWLLTRNPEPKAANLEGYKTEPAVYASIESMISATGSLAAERAQPLAFKTAGSVADVRVVEGAVVRPGETLATLEIDDLQIAVRQAEAQVLVNQATLERARKPATAEEIAAAQAAVDAARASLDDLLRGASWRDRQLSKLAIDQAKNSLWGYQGNRDATAGNPMSQGGSKAVAESQVLNGEIQVQIAELNYAKLFEAPKDSAVASARSQISQTEASLAKLRAMPSKEDIAVAEAQLALARVSVESAQSRLKDATLTAPFGGELARWELHVADDVAPSTIAGTLVDTTRYHIDVNIDETEVGRLAIGQKARITLDAFPDEVVTGRVSKISLTGSSTQGLVTYAVTVALDPTTLPIRPMMTASVNIIVDSKARALLVSNRALRRDRQGKYVEVIANGAPKRIAVTVGLANEDSTEITSGVEQGQEVVVARPRTNMFASGSFGGG